MIRTILIALALGLAGALVSEAALAPAANAQSFDPRSRYSPDEARDARREGRILSAQQVLARVRREFPGDQARVIDLIDGARPYYLVRVARQDGRRYDVEVDARTGRILSVR